MQAFIDLIKSIENETFPLTVNANGVEQIGQTARNALKNRLMAIFATALADAMPENERVARTAEGVLLEIPNRSISDNLTSETGSGALTLCFDIKVKDVDTDLTYESEEYQKKLADKAQKKLENEQKKAKKIAAKKKPKSEE